MEYTTSFRWHDATPITRHDRPPVALAQLPKCGGNCALSVAHNSDNQKKLGPQPELPTTTTVPLQEANSDGNTGRQVDLTADKASIGSSASKTAIKASR